MATRTEALLQEARTFASYLGAQANDEALIQNYCQAIETLQVPLSPKDTKLLQKVITNPFLIPFIDGGLALRDPGNPVRERILVMSALMESNKNYVTHFLVEKDIPYPVLKFLYRGSVALLKGLTGAVVLLFLRWK